MSIGQLFGKTGAICFFKGHRIEYTDKEEEFFKMNPDQILETKCIRCKHLGRLYYDKQRDQIMGYCEHDPDKDPYQGIFVKTVKVSNNTV